MAGCSPFVGGAVAVVVAVVVACVLQRLVDCVQVDFGPVRGLLMSESESEVDWLQHV